MRTGQKLLSIGYGVFTFLTILLVCLDSFFYPTFTLQYLHLNATVILLSYIGITLLFAHNFSLQIPKNLQFLHERVIFPILVLTAFIFLILEHIQFHNFVFSHIHLHPFLFMYLPVISGLIIYSLHIQVEKKILLIFMLPSLFLLFINILSANHEALFSTMVKEDNIFEYLQFLFYFLAAFYALRFSYSQRKTNTYLMFVFLLLGIALFFVAGEEISWGQRLLGIQTPNEMKDINMQDEITVHNLNSIMPLIPITYILIGIYGALSRFIVEKLFKNSRTLLLFTPPSFLLLNFLIVSLFYYQNTYGLYVYTGLTGISKNIYPQNWQEAIEVFLAFGFFGYTYSLFKDLSSKKKKST